MKAIIARNLSKTYWYYEKAAGFAGSIRALFQGKKVFVDAVKEIDLDLHVGEVVGFIGPNGAGKTTTLKMFSGILHPTAGHLEVMGFQPFRREKTFLASINLVMGQRNRLFWDLPAEEYFDFCKVVYEIPDTVFKQNRKELVELAEIGDILNVPQRKLSFGQRKRCELVAALLHDPKIIFLDEPTNALDLINARKMREFIRTRGREGRHTIILTSHIISDIEEVCGRVVIINHGKTVYDGTVHNLTRFNGMKKHIHALFDGPWDKMKLEKLGNIRRTNGQEAWLEVEPEEVSSVAAYLFANFSVKDIDIKDPPLEQVIESIYQSNGIR